MKHAHIIHKDSPPVACECPIHGISYLMQVRYVNNLGTPIWMCNNCLWDIVRNKVEMEIKHDSEVPPPITEDMING